MSQAMYVANTGRQILTFMYRLPEVAQPRQQTIPIGQQIRISGELNTKDIEAIIQQHTKYGLISVDEIGSSKGFAPMIFSLDKPIPAAKIELVSNRNMGVLMERGRDQRKESAIVMATQIGAAVRDQNTGVDLGEVEIDTIEDDSPAAQARRAATGEDRMHETTVVSHEGAQPRRSRRGA